MKTNKAILAPLNINVEEINTKVLNMLPTGEKEYTATNYADTQQANQPDPELCTPEYLATLNPTELQPHKLKLKVNAIIMLIRNLNVNQGLCNGTRLRVIAMQNNVIEAKIVSGTRAGEIAFIPRITISCRDKYQFILYRHQFPIKLAFAMTINKSQGQTFDYIGIDLSSQCFSHGQLYVALSRVRSLDSICIKLHHSNADKTIQNPVYKAILT